MDNREAIRKFLQKNKASQPPPVTMSATTAATPPPVVTNVPVRPSPPRPVPVMIQPKPNNNTRPVNNKPRNNAYKPRNNARPVNNKPRNNADKPKNNARPVNNANQPKPKRSRLGRLKNSFMSLFRSNDALKRNVYKNTPRTKLKRLPNMKIIRTITPKGGLYIQGMPAQSYSRRALIQIARYFGIADKYLKRATKKYLIQRIFMVSQRRFMLVNVGQKKASGVPLSTYKASHLRRMIRRTARTLPRGRVMKNQLVSILLKKKNTQ